MTDMALLNGHKRVTIIESFTGKVVLIRPGFRQEFDDLPEAQGFIRRAGWEINIEIIKGSPILRRMQK